MNFSRQLFSKVIKRYQEAGSNNHSVKRARKCTANTPTNRRKILGRIQRNPRRSTRKIAQMIGISKSSVYQMQKNENLKPYKLQEAYFLEDEKKAIIM